jgi:hypothetical protein
MLRNRPTGVLYWSYPDKQVLTKMTGTLLLVHIPCDDGLRPNLSRSVSNFRYLKAVVR